VRCQWCDSCGRVGALGTLRPDRCNRRPPHAASAACVHARLQPAARCLPLAARRPSRRAPKAPRFSDLCGPNRTTTGTRSAARATERRKLRRCQHPRRSQLLAHCLRRTFSGPAACLLLALLARGSSARLTPRDGMRLCRMCLCRICSCRTCLCLSVGSPCTYFCALKMPCVTHACSQDAVLFVPSPLTHSLPYCDACAGAGGSARVLMRY
jgi:hypothetical protein